MYMDIDSILFGNSAAKAKDSAERWVSRIDHAVLTREDLCVLYGQWADDAAASAFLSPEDGKASGEFAYAA